MNTSAFFGIPQQFATQLIERTGHSSKLTTCPYFLPIGNGPTTDQNEPNIIASNELNTKKTIVKA